MYRIAQFEIVSFEQFKKDWIDTFGDKFNEDEISSIYENIKLPKRATSGSAGYDFFSPYDFTINISESIKIPTGIRCRIDEGWVLTEYPRSSHGFKFGVHLANTVGVIDSDYYGSSNEGHIFIKLVNDSALAKPVKIKAGDAFCQGIFMPYGITVDDDVTAIRNGGFGSTNKQ